MNSAASYFADYVFYGDMRAKKTGAPQPVHALALFASVLIHACLFLYYSDDIKQDTQTKMDTIAVHLQPLSAISEAEKVQPQIDKAYPMPRHTPLPPVAKQEPRPPTPSTTSQNQSKRQPLPSPQVETPMPEPAKSSSSPSSPLAQEAAITTRPAREAMPTREHAQLQQQPLEQKHLENQRQDERREQKRYLANLLTSIESHKHYPRAARQRRMEGEVQISFKLLTSGAIADIQITGASKPLRVATEKALQRALPLPPPPAGMQLPFPVQFRMQYRLEK
jgi:protein TonB